MRAFSPFRDFPSLGCEEGLDPAGESHPFRCNDARVTHGNLKFIDVRLMRHYLARAITVRDPVQRERDVPGEISWQK